MRRFRYDEPNMSDGALLVKVEDLIYMAMGPDTPDAGLQLLSLLCTHTKVQQILALQIVKGHHNAGTNIHKNIVDFKVIQMILHILARQLRMLEQQVEIRFRDVQRLYREASSRREIIPDEKLTDEKTHGNTKFREVEEENELKKELTEINLTDTKTAGADEASAKHKGGKKKSKEPTIGSHKQKSARKGKKEGGKDGIARKSHRQDSLETASSITIHEIERDKSKVLVVDKGPTGSGRPRVGSVEVVTQYQFKILENEVQRLAENVSFSPDLTLPDNEQLKNELLQGNLTLPEAIHALQVNARVQASERAIGRMAEIMTQLAATGVIPEELIRELKEAQRELAAAQGEEAVQGLRSRASSMQRSFEETRSRLPGRRSRSTSQRDLSSFVTRPDLDETLRVLKADLTRNIQQFTSKAALTAEAAANTANTVAARMEIANYLEGRMNEMQSLVADYGVQLSGFDTGLVTQMQGFQDQMAQIRSDLKCGLEQLASAGENSEANAIKELTERYEDLVFELEHVNNTHQAIFKFQANLSDELRSLVEGVEMLRDQKADRDEILDALRDKADISRLAGLLPEEKFNEARADLEKLFEGCHDKFRKQDKAWMSAMEDLMSSGEMKVGHLELVSERDALQHQLQEVHKHLQRLEKQLGEPKAALLMRHLSRDAVCGACGAPALMQPHEEPMPPEFPYAIPAQPLPSTHPIHTGHAGTLPLTSIASAAPPSPEPCTTTATHAAEDDDAELLHRWCGGAHTLQAAGRQRATPLLVEAVPTRRYDGIGTDGKLYLMEEELQPCVKCNPSLYACDGAGDAAFQDPPSSE